MSNQFADSVQTYLDRVRTLRELPPAARRPAVKSHLATLTSRVRGGVRRRLLKGQVRFVERAFGAENANRYYWRAPGGLSDWPSMQRRIEHLCQVDRGSVAHFVRESLAHTSDPVSIVGLARHPLTCDTTRSWLLEQVRGGSAPLAERMQQSRLLGGAFAGAANVLFEPREAESAVEWIAGVYQLPDSRMFQFMDSMGYRPASSAPVLPDADGDTPGDTRVARHRLIIAEHFEDQDSVALLLPGAAHVTLIATSETFGMADFLKYADWPGVGTITVEHVRSRITRYSQAYIDIHEATASAAEQVSVEVAAIPGLLDPSDRPILAVEIADFLFFQALKIRAIEELLKDTQFDHVVLALGSHGPLNEFIHLAAGVRGLMDDPRLEIVSTSRSPRQRASFWSFLDEFDHPSPPLLSSRRNVPDSLVIQKLDESAARLAAGLGRFSAGERPTAVVVTTNNEAYDGSTAAFVRELEQCADVRVLNMGPDASSLEAHLGELGLNVPVDLLAPPVGLFRPLSALLHTRLERAEYEVPDLAGPAEHATAWALRHSLSRLTLAVIGPALARQKALRRWMSSSSRAGTLPDAMILVPQRSPAVSSAAPVARQFQVPTIALEPHAQDANYSRYIKVAADYYGALSDYFRERAPIGFGIDADRVVTIGSPRQVAPQGYVPSEAQRVSRARFEAETGRRFDPDAVYLVFFCQPSEWTHMSTVWDHILEAAQATSSHILLKTHPEESVSRAERYLEQASARGSSDRVVLLDCDAPTAIALSDIVITCYSAAAFDAALRRTPVVCITDGAVRYPVDLPAIVGAPMAHSAAELGELIAAFRDDPVAFESRAGSLIEREPQFVEGPGRRVCDLVTRVIGLGDAAIRPDSEVPNRLFLDGPHPVYPV